MGSGHLRRKLVLSLSFPVNAVVNSRSEPGVIIFDHKKEITFANKIALETFISDDPAGHRNRHYSHYKIPLEISLIHAELKSRTIRVELDNSPDTVYIKRIIQIRGSSFMIRAFAIEDPKSRTAAHFLVLLEKLFARSKIDLTHAGLYYHFSMKESQVVQCLVDGLTNKEIGHRLHIAESTAKEYLRKVMRKVGASTRCGVVAQVLSISDRYSGNGTSKAKQSFSPAS
jgi:DNA-binding CsgD family transcriptional regulator